MRYDIRSSALSAAVCEAEKGTSSVFQELPWHYLEVAHVLLTSAKDCFSSVKEHMEVWFESSGHHIVIFRWQDVARQVAAGPRPHGTSWMID